jgi:hypothetical protein
VPLIAEAYGVSMRTVYRYLADSDSVEEVVATGGWSATFVSRPGTEPRRVTPWERVP